MLKRKDWQYFKDREGNKKRKAVEKELGGESGSDDSQSSESSEELQLDNESGGDSKEEEVDARRIEDLSEDDFDDSESDDLEAQALALKEQWLSARQEDAAKLPRAALACRLCKGVLMLGPVSLKQHMASKKHLARLKRKAGSYEPFCFAAKHVDDSTVETHQERLQRARDAVAPTTASNKKTRRAQRRALKARKAEKTGKPGKRQRAEQKKRPGTKPGPAAPVADRMALEAGKGKPGDMEDQKPVAGSEAPRSVYWSSPAPKQKKQKPKKKKAVAGSDTVEAAPKQKRLKVANRKAAVTL